MLAEKFILLLEALLKSSQIPDGSVRVKSASPHVPVELPTKKYSRIGDIDNGRTDLRCRRTSELSDLIEGHAEPTRMSPNDMTGNTRATAQNV